MSFVIDAGAYSAGHAYAERLLKGHDAHVIELARQTLVQRQRDDDRLSNRERSHYEGAIDWCVEHLRRSARSG